MSNDLPAGYHDSARNYMHATLTGNASAMSPSPFWNAIKPTNLATAVGHALQRGRNSPSQLTHTFGN